MNFIGIKKWKTAFVKFSCVFVFGLSQNAYSQIVNATFNWNGANNYSVKGKFSFDNNQSFNNHVTEDNGALKDLSWAAFSNDVEIYNEVVVSNYAIKNSTYFFDFDYDVGLNIIKFIDTGASDSWFTNNLIYPNTYFTSVLQLNDQTLSSNDYNVNVSFDSLISPVPLPSAFAMFGLGLVVLLSSSQRKQLNGQLAK